MSQFIEKSPQHSKCSTYPADIYLLKVNNRNTRARCKICARLTTELFQSMKKFYCFKRRLGYFKVLEVFQRKTKSLFCNCFMSLKV